VTFRPATANLFHTMFHYDVFLSHNSADKPRVGRLAERLRAAGLRVWFDEWIIQPGDDVYLAIERGLEASRTLVLCLSPAALGSDWVRLERSTVLFRDPANAGRRFVPLLLADCKPPDTLRRYKYVDYRDETHAAFDQLVVGCRSQQQPNPPAEGTAALDRSTPPCAVWVLGSYTDLDPSELAFTKKLLPLFGAGLAQMRIKLVSGRSDMLGDLAKQYLAVSLSARPPGPAPVEIRGKLRQRDLVELFMETIGHVPVLAVVIGGGVSSGRVAEECTAAGDAGIPILPVPATGGAAAEIRLTAVVDPRLYAQLTKPTTDRDASDTANSLLLVVENCVRTRLHPPAEASERRVARGAPRVSREREVTTKEQKEQWSKADEEVRKKLPPGVKLVRTLRGHAGMIGDIAWSPDGRILASPSGDMTIRLWNTETGKCSRILEGHTEGVYSVAFDPTGRLLASGGRDRKVKLWDASTAQCLRTLTGHSYWVWSVAFDPTGRVLASGSADHWIKLWEVASGKTIYTLKGHRDFANCVAFDSTGGMVASAGNDGLVILWDVANGTPARTLEGHSGWVNWVAFSPRGGVVVSASSDKTVRLWNAATGMLLRVLEGHTAPILSAGLSPDGRVLSTWAGDGIRFWNLDDGNSFAVPRESPNEVWPAGVAFHPCSPLIAVVGSDPGTRTDSVIHIWEVNLPLLLGDVVEPTAHYVNAKAVLVGDTSVGKTGLSLVLTRQPYKETDSTAGRHVWTFDSREVRVGKNVTQTRETLLWDLAGQPGYRIIHQLHLKEVTVALVVFDARCETDPLAGVRHWERALRLAHQREGGSGVPMMKFLVSARTDRGTVSVSKERLQALIEEFKFDAYFETSAKEGWKINELRAAIEEAIEWEKLPEVLSSQLFADIKSFLLERKKTGRLLAPVGQLYDEFARQHSGTAAKVANLRNQFDTCIGRLENRDLIRRLTFGEYVLLQPELLDAYASAMVNAAKQEPDGLGSLAEEIALGGKFFLPKGHRVTDPGQEQLLLHATVEELVRHDLALRENVDEGRYLVLPSQFNRDYEDAPEPKGKAVAITFDGPVQSLYSTLAVRLGHSGLFSTGRAEMWRNAAVFTAKAGGKCGLFLHEFAEARGRLILFFPDDLASAETRFHFEEFVLAHARRHGLDGTVEMVRFFVCPDCGDPVPDSYVRRLRDKGKMEFNCPCGGTVSLAEPKERIHFRSKVGVMDRSADRQREFDAFVVSAKGETSTKSFHDWAGGEQVTLAIVFTDVVGSTALGEEIRDEAMNIVRRAHFAQSRQLIGQFQGREIKTIGDSFMAAFKCVSLALDYARALQADAGHSQVQIRAGIHIGTIHVEEGDVFGGTVNFAARVVGAIKEAEIWLSERAKEDIDRLGAAKHKGLKWERHEGVAMKGFPGGFTLWALKN